MGEIRDRRSVILDHAAELFARKGIAATTVREIADAVGILSGSLYHHFDSKESIIDEIISSYLDDLRARYKKVVAATGDPRSCVEGLILASLENADAHPHATEIYQNNVRQLRTIPRFNYLQAAAAEVQATWLDVLKAGARAGTFRDDIEPKVFYRFVRDAVWLSVRWFRPTRSYPLSRLARDCTAVFLDGYLNRADAAE